MSAGPPVYVKICGLTTIDDAVAAAEAGADLLGFIFHPASKRAVTPEQAAAIVSAVRGLLGNHPAPRFVGVFVNEAPARVAAVLETAGLDLAQLHGDEPLEALEQLAGRAYKALRPQSAGEPAEEARAYAALAHGAPRLLVDAWDPDAYGGTGKTADAGAAAALAQAVPGLLLAGGLTPENVAAAIAAVQPWGVDVSSGVEVRPGAKDDAAVRRFIAAAKTAR